MAAAALDDQTYIANWKTDEAKILTRSCFIIVVHCPV